MKIKTLNERGLAAASMTLAEMDPDLALIYKKYGTPPLWDRPEGFPTLVHIILEQQVSLASARACFDKLCFRLGDLTPEALLTLSDSELRTDGFSRQKTAYARHLAEAIREKRIDLDGLRGLSDSDAKAELEKLKGVGSWTSDIYLLMAMLRPDIMPKGDLALHVAFQKLTGAEHRPNSEEFVQMAVKWAPYRSVAARFLWHFYLSERRKSG
jgi:DNA-3-methyladenine glycosylase II